MNLSWFFCKGCRPRIRLNRGNKVFIAAKVDCEYQPCPNCQYFIEDKKEADGYYHIYCRRSPDAK